MVNLERIPDQVGYLEVTEDGAVINSSGELMNCEQLAAECVKLLSVSDEAGSCMFPGEKGFKRISVNYADHCYVICLSNKKIHIVKRRTPPTTEGESLEAA